MTRDEFLTRFIVFQSETTPPSVRFGKTVKRASVLIPLLESSQGLEVLLTVRARHLKHHAGQVSFPGGRIEESDTGVVDAALRESFEEIGLPANHVEIIGQLKPYHTISGYHVTPVIGLISELPDLIADKTEVEEIFTVPLSVFVERKTHIAVPVKNQGQHYNIHFMPYNEYNIWGATAAMLFDLTEQIKTI